MKKIKFIIFIFVLFFSYNLSYSDYVICDSGDINLSGSDVSDVCNGGFQSSDISEIDSFTGTFIDMNVGFFGNSYVDISDIDVNLTVGFFDDFKSSKASNIKPNYEMQPGFLGFSNFYNTGTIDVDNNLSVGFFDDFKFTVISDNNPGFFLPVGYILKSYKNNTNPNINTNINTNTGKIVVDNTGSFPSAIVQKLTIKDFYIHIFKKYSEKEFLKNNYNQDEYEKLIKNLVNLLLSKTYKNSLPFISDIEQKRIELEIMNTDFEYKLSKLLSKMDEINLAFERKSSFVLYMIDYEIKK